MKMIIVTGAAGGIGKAIVNRLAHEGVAVLACDKNGEALKTVVGGCKKHHPNVSIASECFDVTDSVAVARFGTKVAEGYPEVSGLVNNAGIYFGRDLLEYTPEEMLQVLNTNLVSAIQLSQMLGRILVKQQRHGAIVNMSSVSAHEGSSDALYGVSKAGLLGLTQSCALTFAPWVRVNAVAPGLVDTPMLGTIPPWRLAEFEKAERLKGRISPDDVASAVWFLLCDESRHMTGATIDLNNGCYFR